ncbi:S41 family peptidase [Streptomyces sp. WAC 06725]|uniref:S41 family peptidase n=1 Tax=Streptomyces sp. WAC 06725 TaxID=2203209 RepID=UPI0021ADA916|nr:S41 family peptidase [Streptomyces sp. WAC 06725]
MTTHPHTHQHSRPQPHAHPHQPGPTSATTRRTTRPRPSGITLAALATVTALTTLTAACTPPASAHTDQPGRPGHSAQRPSPASLEGVWRTDGYGSLVTIDGRQLRTYETTAVSCLPGSVRGVRTGPPGAGGRADFAVPDGARITVVPRGGDEARLSIQDNVGHRTLHRIAGLPARCHQPPAKDPRTVFDVFWRTYAENYPFFAAKKTDWAAVRDRYRPRVTARTTDDELFAILREMIEPLHDGHTRLSAGPGRVYAGSRPGTTLPTPAFLKQVDAAIAAGLGPGVTRQQWAGGALSYADLPDRLGYLRITSFQGYTDREDYDSDVAELDRALDAVFTKARTSGPKALRGLVVDLRLNGGGSDQLGLRVAARLTGRPYLAYRKHARNDPADARKFTPDEPARIRPHDGPRYTGPLTLLTGPLTISAGETFTQSLLGRTPAPARIGENTQGLFSDTLDRTLPNGWKFALPNEEFLTADGRTFDGTGIPPTVRTPVFTPEDLASRRDPALARARALLSGHQEKP